MIWLRNEKVFGTDRGVALTNRYVVTKLLLKKVFLLSQMSASGCIARCAVFNIMLSCSLLFAVIPVLNWIMRRIACNFSNTFFTCLVLKSVKQYTLHLINALTKQSIDIKVLIKMKTIACSVRIKLQMSSRPFFI